jgi:EAL domain-containing protein (putative c-di-GMP-specific phosphodiesterase class I)
MHRAKSAARDTALFTGLRYALHTAYMHLQPIVQWADEQSLYGYEALLRSRSTALPHPGAILEAAESLDSLQMLGRRVRSLCARRIDTELSEEATLFVNLHCEDLLDDRLYDPSTQFSEYADRIVLELTERANLDDIPELNHRLRRLRAMGFRLAIDDIGSGYSSLTLLTDVEPDIAKIDMSLVRDIDTRPKKQRLTEQLIRMCNDAGALVIAEGVETNGEFCALVGMGCRLFQGYLFGRPSMTPKQPDWAAVRITPQRS